MKPFFLALSLMFTIISCHPPSFDPSKLGIQWELVKNNVDGKGNFLAALTFTNHSQATMPPGGWTIYFSLRYHLPRLASTTKALVIDHVNGDLFTITPGVDFAALRPGESFRMEFTGALKVANFQDVPSGMFWVFSNQPYGAIALAKPVVKRHTGGEKLMAPGDANNFAANATIPEIPEDQLIKVLPTPVTYVTQKGRFVMDHQTVIHSAPAFAKESNYLAGEIEKVTGYRLTVLRETVAGNTIDIEQDTTMPPESYRLSITGSLVRIRAADNAGVFYAIQSLKQLFPIDSWAKKSAAVKIGAVDMADRPRFPVRAFMLDVARNFESKNSILRLLEVLSLYKMNKFHFHFNDDEGWRLEIPGLPELTDIGATRGFPFASHERLQPSFGSGPSEDNPFGTGYYSREDFIEILRYATQRHIEVIPEIESPGHARAAIRSMEARYHRLMKAGNKVEAERYLLHDLQDQSSYSSAQYISDNVLDVSSPAVYAFIDKVIGELQQMYGAAGAPLKTIHMGGDEVAAGAWEKSPAIDRYKKNHPSLQTSKEVYADFFGRVTDLLEKRKLKLTGWEEMIIEHTSGAERTVINNRKYLAAGLQFDAWWEVLGTHDMAYPLANAGYGVVLTCMDYFYFDLAQAPSFDEPGDAWMGYLGLQKVFSFNPFDIYSSLPLDYLLQPIDPARYKNKERLTQAGKKNIRGLQGALWGENMTYDGYLEYQLLPRLLALAERAWTSNASADWSSFANRLGKRELPRLDYYNGGYGYRLPTPSFRQQYGKVSANTELPGIIIRYTTNGSDPVATSPVINAAVEKKGTIKLRAFSASGRGGAIVTVR